MLTNDLSHIIVKQDVSCVNLKYIVHDSNDVDVQEAVKMARKEKGCEINISNRLLINPLYAGTQIAIFEVVCIILKMLILAIPTTMYSALVETNNLGPKSGPVSSKTLHLNM